MTSLCLPFCFLNAFGGYLEFKILAWVSVISPCICKMNQQWDLGQAYLNLSVFICKMDGIIVSILLKIPNLCLGLYRLAFILSFEPTILFIAKNKQEFV